MNKLKIDLIISEINKKLKKKILIKIYVFMLNKYIIFNPNINKFNYDLNKK